MKPLPIFRHALPRPFHRPIPLQRLTRPRHQLYCSSSEPEPPKNGTPKKDPTPNSGPLSHIHILDLSRILAGPFCTQLLSDYGARVTKIEPPGLGDETRHWRNTGESSAWKADTGPMSFYFGAVNRNKRSLTLDLKQDAGKEVVRRMVASGDVDVVVENFVPGGAERLGVGYEVLRQLYPRLVYASISGYGASGPYRGRAGYDAIAAAEGGLMHITGHAEGGPVRPGLGMTDMSTGLYVHGAVLAALMERERTGVGKWVGASLFETQVSMLINVGANWLNRGVEGGRFGAAHPSIVPYDTWRCKDGVWLAVAANNERQYKVFCERLGRPELVEDERFLDNLRRVENRRAMDDILREVFAAKTSEEWLKILNGSGLAHGPVNSIQKAFEHPQTEAREMVREVPWDALESGEWKGIGLPVQIGEAKSGVRTRPPKLGEHCEEVLTEAGYSKAEIEQLKSDKVI